MAKTYHKLNQKYRNDKCRLLKASFSCNIIDYGTFYRYFKQKYLHIFLKFVYMGGRGNVTRDNITRDQVKIWHSPHF